MSFVRRRLLGCCLLAAALALAAAGGAGAAVPNDACRECHGSAEQVTAAAEAFELKLEPARAGRLVVPSMGEGSVHEGFSCVDCHGGAEEIPAFAGSAATAGKAAARARARTNACRVFIGSSGVRVLSGQGEALFSPRRGAAIALMGGMPAPACPSGRRLGGHKVELRPMRLYINDVAVRDGFQMEKTLVPTATKIALIGELARTGLHKIEVTSFVSPKAVPALADANEVLAGIERVPGVVYVALVPNIRGVQNAAATARLGLEKHVTERLPLDVMLPAPGQGALAIQCRADDHETLSLLAALEDPSTRNAVTAERTFLSGLGGGCAVPVAAYAEAGGKGQGPGLIQLRGLVISEDGRKAVHVNRTGTDAQLLGNELAQRAVAQGANEILAGVTA